MASSLRVLAAAALAAAVIAPVAADAQTAHRHVRHPAAEGRQITVYGRESWLTAGTSVPVGSLNNYVLSTFAGGGTTFVPNVDHTNVGVRGLERMPNNFTVPNCCVP
jgi:hypothetical protein